MNFVNWVPAIVTLMTGIITITTSLVVIRSKVDTLGTKEAENKISYTEELKDLKIKVELFSKDLQNAMLQLMLLSKEQSLVNTFSAKTLEGLVKSSEAKDHRISEVEGTLKVLAEIVRRIEASIADCQDCNSGNA